MIMVNDKLTTPSTFSQVVDWVRAMIANITALIPAQASSSNKLADKAYVNNRVDGKLDTITQAEFDAIFNDW